MDLLSRFLFGHDGCSPALFFLVEGLALPSALDVEFIPLVKDRFFYLSDSLEQLGQNPVNIAPPAPLMVSKRLVEGLRIRS